MKQSPKNTQNVPKKCQQAQAQAQAQDDTGAEKNGGALVLSATIRAAITEEASDSEAEAEEGELS